MPYGQMISFDSGSRVCCHQADRSSGRPSLRSLEFVFIIASMKACDDSKQKGRRDERKNQRSSVISSKDARARRDAAAADELCCIFRMNGWKSLKVVLFYKYVHVQRVPKSRACRSARVSMKEEARRGFWKLAS